jgi:SAM-dependent methyltransferase
LKSAALLTSAFADEREISDFPRARALVGRRLRLMAFRYEHDGFCPCCETRQTFAADSEWFRDSLVCRNCGSVVRERALALILRENLESQTFESDTFDLVLTLDVMEHVFDPAKVYAEIWRTLKPGGWYLHTFPIRKHLTEACTPLAKLMPDGRVKHLTEHPEYHGNPIDAKGSLVTHDYGYDVSRAIAQWAPFDVRISRFWDETHGVIGEYTEAVICRKRA